jgi:hypothetical protein
MSPVPMQPSGAEAPAPSPVAAGPEHSNGAAIMPFAWQTVVLGAVGVAATMIHPKDRSGCNMIPQAENTFY